MRIRVSLPDRRTAVMLVWNAASGRMTHLSPLAVDFCPDNPCSIELETGHHPIEDIERDLRDCVGIPVTTLQIEAVRELPDPPSSSARALKELYDNEETWDAHRRVARFTQLVGVQA